MTCVAVLIVGLLSGAVGCGERSPDVQASSTTVPSAIEARSAATPASQPVAWLPLATLLRAEEYARIVDACMKYAPAPDMIVFTQDGSEGVRLRLNPPNPTYRIPDGGGTTAFAPPEWEALNPTPPMSGIHRAGSYGSLIFMHARKTPDKRELLVVVTWPHYSGSHGLRVTVIELDRNDPGKRREVTAFAVPRGALLAAADPQPGLGVVQRLRFFAGQPDPEDDSAWTIRYTVAAHRDAKALPGLIQMKLTGEPELANHDCPSRHQGKVPMQVSVQRPDGTLWTN